MTRFYTFGVVGAVLVGVSMGLVAGLAHGLGLIGSCSSSGYINGRPAPPCSAADTLKIVGIFPAIGLGLLGLVISGRRAPRHKRTGSFGVAAWSMGYLVVGTSLILTSQNPASKAGGFDRWGWAIPGFIFIPLGIGGLIFLLFRRRKSALAQRLLAEGVNTTGVITSVRDTGVTINNNPRIALELDVKTAGGPMKLSKTVTVSRVAIPRQGDTVQVWYDRNDPNTFAIGIPTGPQSAAPVATLQALQGHPDVPPELAGRLGDALRAMNGGMPTAPVATPGDLTATLERLATLHKSGALSDVEFESAKARALAGS